MRELLHDPVFGMCALISCLGILGVVSLPIIDMFTYYDLSQKHFTPWGAILHLADNMEMNAKSWITFFLFEILRLTLIIVLTYIVVIEISCFISFCKGH